MAGERQQSAISLDDRIVDGLICPFTAVFTSVRRPPEQLCVQRKREDGSTIFSYLRLKQRCPSDPTLAYMRVTLHVKLIENQQVIPLISGRRTNYTIVCTPKCVSSPQMVVLSPPRLGCSGCDMLGNVEFPPFRSTLTSVLALIRRDG